MPKSDGRFCIVGGPGEGLSYAGAYSIPRPREALFGGGGVRVAYFVSS